MPFYTHQIGRNFRVWQIKFWQGCSEKSMHCCAVTIWHYPENWSCAFPRDRHPFARVAGKHLCTCAPGKINKVCRAAICSSKASETSEMPKRPEKGDGALVPRITVQQRQSMNCHHKHMGTPSGECAGSTKQVADAYI